MVKRWWWVFLLVACTPVLAFADPLKLKWTTTVAEKFNDNVLFSVDQPEEDFLTHIAPGLQGGWKTEVTDLLVSARADIYVYQETDGLDSVDQSYNGQLYHSWGPRFSTTLTAGYVDDESRERELTETGLLFNDVNRRRQTYGLNGQYQVSEKSSVSLSYSYSTDDFDDETEYDIEVHTAQLALARSLAPFLERATGRFQLVGGHYIYQRDYRTTDAFSNLFHMEDEQVIDYYSATIGLQHNWSERLTLSIDVGARNTRNETMNRMEIEPNPLNIPVQLNEDETDSEGYVGDLEIQYRFTNSQLSLLASHDLVPASGREGTTERTTLRIGMNGRLGSQWSYSWSAKGYLNTSDGSEVTSDDDELTITLSVGLWYAFNNHWRLGAYWNRSDIEDRVTDLERTRNTFTLKLQWDWDVLE